MTYTIQREAFPALVAGHGAKYLVGMIQAFPESEALLLEAYIKTVDSTHQPSFEEVEALTPDQTMPSLYYRLSNQIDCKVTNRARQEVSRSLLQITELAVLIDKYPAASETAIPAAIMRLMHLSRIRPYRIVRNMMIEYWPNYEKQIRAEWKSTPRRSAALKEFSAAPTFRNIALSILADPSNYLQNKLLDDWVLAHVEEQAGTFRVQCYSMTSRGSRLLKYTASIQKISEHGTEPTFVVLDSHTGSGNLKALTKQFAADARRLRIPQDIVAARSYWFISSNDATNTAFAEQAVRQYLAFFQRTTKKLSADSRKKPA